MYRNLFIYENIEAQVYVTLRDTETLAIVPSHWRQQAEEIVILSSAKYNPVFRNICGSLMLSREAEIHPVCHSKKHGQITFLILYQQQQILWIEE